MIFKYGAVESSIHFALLNKYTIDRVTATKIEHALIKNDYIDDKNNFVFFKI